MGSLHDINQKGVFTLEEARKLLPLVKRITKNAQQSVAFLSAQRHYMPDKKNRAVIENKIQASFQKWHTKVQKLGGIAKGMWLVDFDNGEGFYCWHYPETDIGYHHGYHEGFSCRAKNGVES